MKHFLGILFAMTSSVSFGADAISFGMRGGLPFGEGLQAVETREFSAKGHQSFVLGPTVELRLPMGFGASFDFLYRRLRTDSSNGTRSGGQWEFPFMARFRMPGIVAHPFFGAGPVFYKVMGIPSLGDTAGVVFGGGIDVKIPFVHLTPEFRYQRRFSEKTIGGLLQGQNQVDLLLGVTF